MRLMQTYDDCLEVHSAGTLPAPQVNPHAVRVMEEIGLDMSEAFPKSVDRYLHQPWDYVITVCDHAHESCPVFTGHVRHRIHLAFPDPALATGTDDEVIRTFRTVRDEISEALSSLFAYEIKEQLSKP